MSHSYFLFVYRPICFQNVIYAQSILKKEQKVDGTKRALKICEQDTTIILNMFSEENIIICSLFMLMNTILIGRKEECTTIIGTKRGTIQTSI